VVVSYMNMSINVFKNIVLPTKDKLYRFALRMLRDEDEAKDVVQEVLIKVWNKRENMETVQNVEAWCMQITKNHVLDKVKTKRYKLTDSMEDGFDLSDNSSSSPARITETNDTMENINKIINALPEKQKQVIQLRDIEGFSYKEIGDIMGVDLSQVKVNLFRARKSVKDNLLNINAYGL
jgi:RNA polymerase sigma factor (sigma-70 family)